MPKLSQQTTIRENESGETSEMSMRQVMQGGARSREPNRLVALSTDQNTIQTYLHNVYNND
jgi:hypothetical protein